jgi:hypothetical protein
MTTAETNWSNRRSVPIIYTLNNGEQEYKAKTSLYITPEIIGSCLQIYVTSYQSHGDVFFLTRFVFVK